MVKSNGSKNPPRDLPTLVARRFEWSMATPEAFFAREAQRIAEACWAMARRFHQGGRLLAFGHGAWTTDAQHVAVEFVHPVIVGKRALPALALSNDSATLSGLMAGGSAGIVRGKFKFWHVRRILHWASLRMKRRCGGGLDSCTWDGSAHARSGWRKWWLVEAHRLDFFFAVNTP